MAGNADKLDSTKWHQNDHIIINAIKNQDKDEINEIEASLNKFLTKNLKKKMRITIRMRKNMLWKMCTRI